MQRVVISTSRYIVCGRCGKPLEVDLEDDLIIVKPCNSCEAVNNVILNDQLNTALDWIYTWASNALADDRDDCMAKGAMDLYMEITGTGDCNESNDDS